MPQYLQFVKDQEGVVMLKELKIAQLGSWIPIPPPGWGGVWSSVFQLSKTLSEKGCKISIIGVKGHITSERLNLSFYEIPSLPIPSYGFFAHLKTLCCSFLIILRLFILVKKKEVQIIHAHGQTQAFLSILAKKIFRWKTPIVYTCHNPYVLSEFNFLTKILNLFEPFALHFSDAIIAQTESVAKVLTGRFRIKTSKIKVIPTLNFIETPRVGRKSPNSFIVLNVGIICHRKNQLALVKTIPKVIKEVPNVKFIFIGPVKDSSYFKILNEFIEKENLSNYVKFCGEVSPQELYQAYESATLFAFPTLAETQGAVVLEAMSFGLPVIASKIGPIEDIVKLEPGCAKLINSNDTSELANAIITVLKDKKIAEEMSVKGKKLAERLNTEIPLKIRELYESLLEN